MFKIAWAVKMTFTDRTDVVFIKVVEVFYASRVPDHPIAIIASLAYYSVLSRAVMFKQIIPRLPVKIAYRATMVAARIVKMLRDGVTARKISLTSIAVHALEVALAFSIHPP